MSVRPPRQFSKDFQDPVSAALEQEVLAEKAGTLARLGTVLERRLKRLAEFEVAAASGQHAGTGEALRDRLVAEAGEALWHVVIQRELCGLRNTRAFYEGYRVPKAVMLRMGPAGRS